MKRLKPGERVRMTQAAIDQRMQGPRNRRLGVVVSVNDLAPEYIRVRRDGLKTVEQYADIFWERDYA